MAEAIVLDVKHLAKEGEDFRSVLFTGPTSQLVIMSLAPGEEIGEEVHEVDQLIYAVEGEGEVEISGSVQPFEKGRIFCVPAGTRHNVINTEHEPLKLFTVYAPPQHAPGTVQRTKAEAMATEKETVTA